MPAVGRQRRQLAVRGAREERQSPGQGAAAPACGPAHGRAGEAARREATSTRACSRSASATWRMAGPWSSRSPTTAATPTISSPSSASRREAMLREAAESAAVVRAQLAREPRADAANWGRCCATLAPRAVVTFARGSSDHAATYARYLLETRCGVLTSSAAPSVSSVYSARPDLRGALCLAISQSGRSPDLLAAADSARAAGAKVVALVNAEDAPLAGARRPRHLAARRARNQRGRDQVAHRVARRDPAARRRMAARRRNLRDALRVAPDGARPRMAARLERGDRHTSRMRAASSCSGAASASASPRRPH